MKRIFKMLSVILLVVVLTGCVKQTVNTSITSDEITIEITSAMDSSLMTEEDVASMLEEYKEYGFDVREYEAEADENLLGIVYSKTYKLEDVSGAEAVEFHLETIDEALIGELPPKMFKKTDNIYQATMIFDTTEADTGDYTDEELESYASSFEISYSVTLPSPAISHNADTVEGNTYTWNIEYGEKANINYEFNPTVEESTPIVETPDDDSSVNEPEGEEEQLSDEAEKKEESSEEDSQPIWLYVLIGAGVIVIILVIVLIMKNKKGNNVPPTSPNGVNLPPQVPTQTPVQPVQTSVAPTEPGVYVNDGTQVVVPPTQEPPTDQNQNIQ